MSDTPELDDMIRVANAAVAVARALQDKRDEWNQVQTATAEAGAAGCRDLIIYMANQTRDIALKPIEIVEDQLPGHILKAIRDRPGAIE